MQGPNRDEFEVFNTSRRIGAAADRDAYLRQACGDDLALRARVEALLRVDDEDPGFLAAPLGGEAPVSGSAEPRGERPGAHVRPYTLLEPIGEGDFGLVFAADRAMDRLRKALAAGDKDLTSLVTDTDLDALRGRVDFQKLLAELQGGNGAPGNSEPP
jgi:hypothetical protein